MPNPLADFFPFIESPPSQAPSPKSLGLFLYSGPSQPFSGDLHGRSTRRHGRRRPCSTACAALGAQARGYRDAGRSAPAPPLKSGLDLAGFDRSVRPQDDLYRFAGGTWLANTEIPPDRSNYGSFIILDDQAQEEVKQLIVAASHAGRIAPPGSDAQKVGDLLPRLHGHRRAWRASGSRRSRPNWRASTPSPRRAMWRATSATRSASASRSRSPGSRRPTTRTRRVYLGALFQNGLTMPDRDYYLSPDEKYAQFRAKFAEYVEQMLARAGERNAKSAAARIAALETRIANYQWTKVQNRDPVKTYNPMTLPEYQKLAPGFDWLAFFEGMGAPVQRLDVSQPTFIKGIGQLVKTVPVSDWRVYFKFQLLDDYAPALSAQFADLEFDFHQHTLNGVPEPRPRWRRAVDSMDNNMGELVGRMFVESHFGAEAKATHARAGRQPAQGVRHLDRRARVDEPGHARRGEEEAVEDHREDRLSRQVARLLRADRAQRRPRRQPAARRGVPAPALRRAHRRPGRQGRVADDAADRQRVLQLRPPTRSRSRPPSCVRRSST